MRDIWKPLERSWAAKLGGLSLVVSASAGLMHWTMLGLIAAFILVGCCAWIAEMQVKILKDHVQELEERIDDLEGRSK